MKRIFKVSALCAIVVAALVSCNKQIEVVPEGNENGIVLNFASERPGLVDADTKTVYNSETGTIDWSSGDKIRVGITVNDVWMAASDAPAEGKSAKLYISNQVSLQENGYKGIFSVPTSFTVATEGTYKFYGLYPSTLVSDTDAAYIPSVSITIPAAQTPSAASFDNAADVMYAVSGEYDGIPDEDRSISLTWTRVVAHGDITLKNLPTFESGESIKTITFTAQDGADLAGYHYIDITNGSITLPEGSTAVNTITVDASKLAVNSDNTLRVWFAALPFTATSLTVVITTNKYTYTKSYSGISKEFKVNKRNYLGISMANAEKEDVPVEPQLIEDGAYVIALMGESNLNEDLMMEASTSGSIQSYDVLGTTYTPDGKLSVSGEFVWVFKYDAKNAVYSIKSLSENKYLDGSPGSNNLELENSGADFYISEQGTENGYNLYHISVLSSSDERWIAFNYNGGDARFALYKDDSLYPGKVRIIPAVASNLTPALTFTNTTVDVAASSTTASFYYTAQNLTVAPTVVVTTDENSIVSNATVDTDNNCVVVTLEANTETTAKSAALTVSCADIADDITLTVNQAGKTNTVEDVINLALTGVSESSYTDWSDKQTSTSDAVYAGNSAANGTAIQLKSKNSSGIVTTTSAGTIKKIVVTWATNTTTGRTIDIYGKNSAYESASDLYSNSTKGTKIGSIVYGTSTELIIDDNYEYIGIRSNDGALYVNEIKITWGNAKSAAPISWSASTAEATFVSTDPSTGLEFTAPTFNNTENLAVTYESSDSDVATVTSEGVVTPVDEGTAIISASFAGNDTYKATTVSYTLTVKDEIPVVATPTFSPQSGSVEANSKVTISCATDGATIYYTIDNSTPSTSSTEGTEVTIDVAKTIKAIAVKAGYKDSEVATATYSITGEDVIVLSEEFDNDSESDSNTEISNTTFDNFNGSTSKAYKSQYGGIKLGASKSAGYITSKSLDLSSSFTVQINVRKYGTDTGIVQVTVGSVTKTITPTDTDTQYTLDFDAATSTSTVKIGTSSKRAYIDNVIITRH